MVCPFCLNSGTRVYNSRSTAKLNNTWRRRRCESCQKTFTTVESVDPRTVLRVKVGKATTPFDRTELVMSLLKACDHLEEPGTVANYIAEVILQKLYKLAPQQAQIISKNDIVHIALRTLKNYDLAAYIKYLSYHGSKLDTATLKKRLKEVPTTS